MMKYNKQKGAAIIMALFVTSLVTIMACAMILRLQVDMRRTELLTQATQAYFYAEGSVAWAMEQLNNDWNQKKSTQLVDMTPIKSPVNIVNNYHIASTIYDPQGRFNLNNLTNNAFLPGFIRLLRLTNPTLSEENARSIGIAVTDWISSSSKNTELESYYLKQTPAYQAPHRLMYSVSELRLVKGVTAEVYSHLAPYVMALPEATQININSASAEVLMAISTSLTLANANQVVSQRRQSPFQTTSAFLATELGKKSGIPEDKITTISHYFLVKTKITIHEQVILLYTLIQRIEKNKKPYEIIIWQSQGTL